MRCLILDGHPDGGRLVSALLDAYAAALPAGTEVVRMAIRDMGFDPDMKRGYAAPAPLEPDLVALTQEMDSCDHLVIGFPMWWGAEPAIVKGLLDRVLLPGWAFKYHRDDPMWDRLLSGRSADVVITMDTPLWYLRLAYGNAIVKRWKRQVLGFVGFRPVRVFCFGPTRKGGSEKQFSDWADKLALAAGSSPALKRAAKLAAPLT